MDLVPSQTNLGLILLQANLDLLATRIADLVRESERLGEEGDVDASQAAAQQADTLKVHPSHTVQRTSLYWGRLPIFNLVVLVLFSYSIFNSSIRFVCL